MKLLLLKYYFHKVKVKKQPQSKNIEKQFICNQEIT